jgi:hypothetical protein
VRASHDALVELLEPMKDFFERLGVYTQIPLTAEMAEVLVKIVAEIFSILSIATKEVNGSEQVSYCYKIYLTLDQLTTNSIRNLSQEPVGKDRH